MITRAITERVHTPHQPGLPLSIASGAKCENFERMAPKIEALVDLLVTSYIYKRFLKDLKLTITNMCQKG